MVEAQLADLEQALERVPASLYEALTLRGLEQRTNVEAARAVGVHPNTMSRRYMNGLRWLVDYLNEPRTLVQRRAVSWRAWATANVEAVLAAVEDDARPGPGRPPQISLAVDERALRLHCAGSTERAIVDALNLEFPRSGGRQWTRSSVRSILRRYRAPKRPPGRRPAPGRYRFGDVTQPTYREVEFGEPLCDPDELLAGR